MKYEGDHGAVGDFFVVIRECAGQLTGGTVSPATHRRDVLNEGEGNSSPWKANFFNGSPRETLGFAKSFPRHEWAVDDSGFQ